MGCEVICGDARDLPDIGRFHAILCDPPYEIGFMNKAFDKTGVAFDPATWEALLSVLHPGGFGMAFGGSRTYHRLACAIEDAGAVLHPMIGWAYGSGFPKATRIDTQVDRDAGAEREVVGENPYSSPGRKPGAFHINGGNHRPMLEERMTEQGIDKPLVTAPATPLASTWSGHRYGLQALKPALEPICCFQRPYEGKPWECITRTGAGALNIEAARVEGTPRTTHADGNRRTRNDGPTMHEGLGVGEYASPSGRWPANLVLGHSPDCNGTCADGCAVKALGEQSGESGASWRRPQPDREYADSIFPKPMMDRGERGHADFGSCARFFTQVDWALEQAEPVRYQAKASRRERDAGLEERETRPSPKTNEGLGRACSLKARREQSGDEHIRLHNPHPTVKPIALARHLATLLLPPPEYAPRRILIPFAGSGSEMIGALLAGWEEVVGIEMDAEYCEIARARIAHWMKQPALELA